MKYVSVLIILGIGLGLVGIGLGLAQGDGLPNDGAWVGAVRFTIGENEYQADLGFVMNDGAIDGQVKLVFTYPTISEELMGYMLENGCVVVFDEIDDGGRPLGGYFPSVTTARGTFEFTTCQLEPYGELQFAQPLRGNWSAAWSETPALTTAQPATTMPTVMATQVSTIVPNIEPTVVPATTVAAGPQPDYTPDELQVTYDLFLYRCSECHGEDAEGGDSGPTLLTRELQRKPVELFRDIIVNGIAGTEMSGFGYLLTVDEQYGLIYLLQNWETVQATIGG